MRLKLIVCLAALALASGLCAQLTAFNLTWTDDTGDGDYGLDPSINLLGLWPGTSTNAYEDGVDLEKPPAGPEAAVTLISYTSDYYECIEEYRPGVEGPAGVYTVSFLGDALPTAWPRNTQAGDSMLSWSNIGDGWLSLSILVDGTDTYDMLVDTDAYLYVGGALGQNYAFKITGVYAIPEPASLAMLGTGLIGLVTLARKR